MLLNRNSMHCVLRKGVEGRDVASGGGIGGHAPHTAIFSIASNCVKKLLA